MYGKNINSILQGNVGNILYIKSTDDSMLQILEQLSGKMYRIEHDSQTISTDMYKVINRTDGKLSKNRTVKEVPVITKNNMLQVTRGDLMVFGKSGGNPIWNTNQCAMPYSFMLLGNNKLENFEDPQKYTLRTVPTTANTMDFDILGNIPNFQWMVSKRVEQAKQVDKKRELFKQMHKINGKSLDDNDLAKMNVEALSEELMWSINEQLAFNQQQKTGASANGGVVDEDFSNDELMAGPEAGNVALTAGATAETMDAVANGETNTEFIQESAQAEQLDQQQNALLYAKHHLSRDDVKNATDDTKEELITAYVQCMDDFKRDDQFEVDSDQNLKLNGVVMIAHVSDLTDTAKEDFGDDDLSAFMAHDEKLPLNNFVVKPAWLDYLSNLPDWHGILQGMYDTQVGAAYEQAENS